MTKILAITARADIGGGPEHLFQLTKGYGKRAKVIIACPNDAPYFARYQTLDNVPDVIEIPHRAFRLGAVWRLRAKARAAGVHVIHSHGKGAGIYGRLLSVLTGIPCIHTFHGLHTGEYSPTKRALYLRIERVLGWATRAAICVSGGEAAQITAANILPEPKINTIPNGVAVPASLPDRPAPHDPLRIVAVSRFDHQKNPMMLVEIALALKFALGDGFRLTVMGQGDQFDAVAARITAEGLADHIHLIGPTTSPRAVLQDNDIFVSTSRWEGLPLAVLEAMSEGLVPVLSDVVGNRDVVENGQTGILFALNDPKAGADALIAARDDWTNLRHAAFDVVGQTFSVARMADQTLALTRRVTGH